MDIQEKTYDIERHDLSNDRSLRSWSAADEYLLQAFAEIEQQPNQLVIYNDRFGYLGCHLNEFTPTIVLTQKSQEKAISVNLEVNDLPALPFSNPLEPLEKEMDLALIKIPKSTALFQLFLKQIVHHSTDGVTVICSFMTRHFSPKLLQIASEYFEVAEQSKALKKARLLTLSKKKTSNKKEAITSLTYKDQVYQQYWGVFSADHIDYATQFFIEHLELKESDQRILDLASGNGIIGIEISKQIPEAEVHLMDDSFLAVASAKLNTQSKNIHHHYNNDLSIFEDDSFDLIVTNPPFHFEYEVNIHIALNLFRDCRRCLKAGGRFQLVASRHLNYRVHLEKLFSEVVVLGENEKFLVYNCLM